jgi:hypothetical protein
VARRAVASLSLLVCFVAAPRLARAQADTTHRAADSVLTRWVPHFNVPPLTLREPPALRAPWLGAPRVTPRLAAMAWDSALAATLDSAHRAQERDYRYLAIYGPGAVAPASEFEEAPPPGAEADKGVLGVARKYADLTIDGQARLDIRTDRLRNESCTAAQLFDPNSGCQGGFKAPHIENQFNIKSGGLIGRRLHINVDYDTQRDFSANQNIQVYYEGLEDEVVRRVEVGSITFRPPPSRFITAAIPSSNFGVNATFDIGRFQVQALAATQKGSQVATRTFTVGATTSAPQDRQIRDVDFESGRFFWVVDPAKLPAYPAVDVLNLDPTQLPATERPTQVRVYRYRASATRTGVNPNLGGINALATRRDGSGQQFGGDQTFWELLIQGTDYYVDPSGLWIALNTKLDENDYLAVSFTTAAGGRVGTFPATDTPNFTDTLELVVEPHRGPEAATFRYEMRQIYRVGGADVDQSSLLVNLSLNRSERPLSGASATYLGALGLAVPTDPTVFDRYNRLFPRSRDAGATQVIHDSYIVFPALRPFADPTRLTPAERSDTIYRTPLYLVLSPEGPPAKFQFRLRYNSTGAGDRTTLNLNAIQIKDGSEKLSVGSRDLVRGTDYSIAYETGTVTFLNPDAIFGTGSAQVTATFEERGVFAVAPTSIFGFTTRYAVGENGAINLLALYQREASAFNRPQLGFEATANLIGGINTELHFRPKALTRLFNAFTTGHSTAESHIDLNGEFAFSKPDPNRSGTAYIEEFESDASVQVPLRENLWEFGSRPQRPDGVEDLFPAGFDSTDAVQLTWQNLVPAGNDVFQVHPQDIDPSIVLAGSSNSQSQLETALFVTLHADTAGGVVDNNNRSHWTLPARPGAPRWRSMVTPLSSTGLDFTRNDFLEFWVYETGQHTADSAGIRLIFDLGSVNEDALALAPTTISVNGADTTYTGRRYIGVGRLDTEQRSSGIFNADVDDNGILSDVADTLVDASTNALVLDTPLCQRELGAAVPVFPWGDLSARCTRGNGTLDTEDLNGDNTLNASGAADNVFRFIVDLRDPKYFVRTGGTDVNGGGWRLYRVPIRSPDATIGSPNLRLIQQLRLTVVAPPGVDSAKVGRFGLARMRFVGAPWARRTDRPAPGLFGQTAGPTGEVVVSVVSTENKADLGYTSPPGVVDALARKDQLQQQIATQINEKSLRIIATGLQVGNHAEAYLRFPSGPQSMLSYRTLRVWMRGRGAGWDEGDFQAYVKLGSDAENFYLYRAPAKSSDWLPEMVIDLDTWRTLRAQIESRWLSGQPPSGSAGCPGTDSLAYVACQGGYVVQVRDPAINPPNLAAAQEVAAGIYRVAQATAAPDAELWVDDIRLDSPVSQTGTAVALESRVSASDVADLAITYTRQDGQFRQLNENPTYRTNSAVTASTTWRLDRFLPQSLGFAMPVTVSIARNSVDPQLLTGTDIRGDALDGLRRPNGWSTTYSGIIRRQVRGSNWLSRGFLDPLSFTGTYTRGRSVAELQDARNSNFNFAGGYNLSLSRRGFRLPFGGIVGSLPRWLRESEGGKALSSAGVSLVPTNVRLSSTLSRDESELTAFNLPIGLPTDALLAPSVSLQHLWRNSAGLTWQPLGMLTLSTDLASTRDLRVYDDSSSLGRLAYDERRLFLGVPVGVERDRTLNSSVTLAPRISSWLRPRYVRTSNFVLSRTLNSRDPVRAGVDSTGPFLLPQTLNNQRSTEIGASVDFARGLRQLLGDSSAIGHFMRRVRPVDITNRHVLSSVYDLAAFDPNVGFMLGNGALDDFLAHEGQQARGVNDTKQMTVASGADLPLGLSASVSYGLTRNESYQLVGQSLLPTTQRQVEWPVGNLRWTVPFRGGPLTLVALGTTIRVRRSTSLRPTPGGTSVQSETRSSTVSPSAQVTLRNGLALTGTYSGLTQHTANNGNTTLLDQKDFQGALNYSFRAPEALGRNRRLIRSSLTAITSVARSCLERGDQSDCLVISDVYRREIRGGLDTDLAKSLTGGLQIGYTLNDARHLSRRTSQISILAEFQLSLFAGDYR